MRNAIRIFLGTAFTLALAGPVLALDCQQDFEKLTSRAQSANNSVAASAKKGKLDPVAACPRLRNLVSVQDQMLSYMVKNKDWCHVPDEAIANAKVGRGKTAAIAGKACSLSAQVANLKRQQQQQQAAGGAQGGGAPQPARLPTGPL